MTKISTLCLASCVVIAACGDSKPATQGSAGAPAITAGMAAPVWEPKTEPERIVADVIKSFDHQVEVNCPCFVAMGAYPSVPQCVQWQHSREDWAPCLSGVLAKHNTPETLEAFRCYAKLMGEQQACLGAMPCDPMQRAMCIRSPGECVGEQFAILLEASATCPDVALLMRQM